MAAMAVTSATAMYVSSSLSGTSSRRVVASAEQPWLVESCMHVARPSLHAGAHVNLSASAALGNNWSLSTPNKHQLKKTLGCREAVVRVINSADADVISEDASGDYSRGRTMQKVKVTLGPYKGGAIKVKAIKQEVTEEDVTKALKEKQGKTHDFQRINFTGSGAKLGHTVKINFEGKYADGPNSGQLIKGTKADMYDLELKEREDYPWKRFVEEITIAGMGQEESKTFMVVFPADFKAPHLQNVKARFTVTVKAIGLKRALALDTRSEQEQRAEIKAQMVAAEERSTNIQVDAELRRALLETSEADVDKIAASVSWAKFGENSLKDFKWNLLMEEIAREENILFEEVMPFLRREADITFVV